MDVAAEDEAPQGAAKYTTSCQQSFKCDTKCCVRQVMHTDCKNLDSLKQANSNSQEPHLQLLFHYLVIGISPGLTNQAQVRKQQRPAKLHGSVSSDKCNTSICGLSNPIWQRARGHQCMRPHVHTKPGIQQHEYASEEALVRATLHALTVTHVLTQAGPAPHN